MVHSHIDSIFIRPFHGEMLTIKFWARVPHFQVEPMSSSAGEPVDVHDLIHMENRSNL